MRIVFENISFGYEKDVPVFKNVSFSIEKPPQKGFILGLLGDSGSGKSTLLKLLLHTEKLWTGKITIEQDNPIVSYVPQEPIMFEHLTLYENAVFFSRTERLSKLFEDNLYQDMVDTLGMKDLLEKTKSVNEISGGQKQRIALIRALSINPDILLLDEPLTGLDERVKYFFLSTISKLANKYNLLVIYITHHRQEVELIADEIAYLIKDDKTGYVSDVYLNSPQEFFRTPPTVSALYMLKKHETNILPIRLDSDKNLKLCENKIDIDGDFFYISFDEDIIFFSEREGWEFKLNSESGNYIFLELTGSSFILTLSKNKRDAIIGKKNLLLRGMATFYQNSKYVLSNRIYNNKMIVNEE